MESAQPSDDLRRVVTSLTDSGASELFVDARSLSKDVLSLWAGSIASFYPGPFTFLSEPATTAQVENLLDSGASRIAVQRRALEDPDFMAESTRRLGSGSLAVVIAARRENESWRVYTGKPGVATEWDAITWARVAEAQGAAELIVEASPEASSDEPYDLELLSAVARAVARPVIALGEPRSFEDCLDALLVGDADAVLLTPALVSGPRSLEAIRLFFGEHGVSCP